MSIARIVSPVALALTYPLHCIACAHNIIYANCIPFPALYSLAYCILWRIGSRCVLQHNLLLTDKTGHKCAKFITECRACEIVTLIISKRYEVHGRLKIRLLIFMKPSSGNDPRERVDPVQFLKKSKIIKCTKSR